MKKIGIFIICAQTFMHFAAGKSYEKYIKLLIGIMILAQFIVPVRAVFLKGEEAEIWEEIERFQMEMENVLEDTAAISENKEDTVEVLETEIREKLRETAEEYGYIITEVQVCEEPPVITVTVSGRTKEDEKNRVEQLKKVKRIKIETEEKKQAEEMENAEETENVEKIESAEDMRKRFGIVLGIDESYIKICTR